jgi:hypothetical protein
VGIVSRSQGGGGGGATTQIFDSTLGAPAANIDIAAIPAAFNHLMLVMFLRGDTAAVATTLQATLNNDGGANYDWEEVINATGANAQGQTSARAGRFPANTAAAGDFATITGYIANYRDATNKKSYAATIGGREGTGAGSFKSGTYGFSWLGAAAIVNRITLAPAAGNFVAGSRVTLYGLL